MAEPITLAMAKTQCRVLHDDEDDLIRLHIATARRRCERLTGLTLTVDVEGEADDIQPTIKQAILMLVAGYNADRDGTGHTAAAEKAVQNLLFNERLMIHELPEADA